MSVCLLARSVVVVEAEKMEEEKELKKTGGGSYFRLLTDFLLHVYPTFSSDKF